jgi:predicted ATPase/DNA-binding winged helix-turn-helix (wHTH) protein
MTLNNGGRAKPQAGDSTYASGERSFSFGSFRLIPAQQLLLDSETPVPLGSRAMEILLALVERPGELVGKTELMARVWPKSVVEEGNLKVHVASLRRALGDGRSGRRYVVAVPGRGYRFVERVELLTPSNPGRGRPSNLPSSSTRTIDRVEAVEALEQLLLRHRFVTIVGPAGIGKTTVALALGEARLPAYGDGVWLVDLAPLSDPKFIPGALASVLGVTLHSESMAALIACMRERRMLIVFDSCEHLTEAVAALAEQLISGAPSVHVISTSRERLRAKGERVYRLPPLPSPPTSMGLTVQEALRYPAIELFVERAEASLDTFELTDTNASDVADICRKLEGIALAIELTATRVDAFGPRELSTLLDDRFQLLYPGEEAAAHRHRSLAAALDWSHDYLSERERTILRRLSVFTASFSLRSAGAVAADRNVSEAEVTEGIASLVAKSLVSANLSGTAAEYRLLETTRAYAHQKLIESGELDAVQRSHAMHHLDLFERAESDPELRPTAQWLADYGRKIDDVRCALDWAFSQHGDDSVGVMLTVAAIPLWIHLSQLVECRARVELALARDTAESGLKDRHRMKFSAALAAALLYTKGPLPETEAAWTRTLQIAESVGDREYQLRALWGLSIYRVYVGEYRAALELSETYREVASRHGDLADQLGGERLAATALFYFGEFASARSTLNHVLTKYAGPTHQPLHVTRFQFDQRVAARSTLANLLWLQGFPEQAVRTARMAIEDAQKTDHPLSLCNALGYAAFPIALYVGDLAEAERLLAALLGHLAKHALTVWNSQGACLQGILLIKQGQESGFVLLQKALEELREAGFRLRYSSYVGMFAQGLAIAGHKERARSMIEEALAWSSRTGARWFYAELLRIKGDLYRTERSVSALATAQNCYKEAIDCARRQQALSWELRAALGLAQLVHQEGRTREGFELLSSVYERFTEGFETLDLREARSLIDAFRAALR